MMLKADASRAEQDSAYISTNPFCVKQSSDFITYDRQDRVGLPSHVNAYPAVDLLFAIIHALRF